MPPPLQSIVGGGTRPDTPLLWVKKRDSRKSYIQVCSQCLSAPSYVMKFAPTDVIENCLVLWFRVVLFKYLDAVATSTGYAGRRHLSWLACNVTGFWKTLTAIVGKYVTSHIGK